MKKEYYLGRKNKRHTYWIYIKQTKEENPVNKISWWKCVIANDKLDHWVNCNMLPEDMKLITDQEALEFLFPFCI